MGTDNILIVDDERNIIEALKRTFIFTARMYCTISRPDRLQCFGKAAKAGSKRASRSVAVFHYAGPGSAHTRPIQRNRRTALRV